MTVLQQHSKIPGSFKGEVKRSELLRHVKSASDAKLVALFAPSGYGKTTLLAQWARSARSKSIWITLNLEDSDIHHFVFKVCHALQTQGLFPNITLNLQDLHLWPLEQFRQLILQHLGDTRSNIKIILDKTEWLTENSIEWLKSLIQRLPEGHQILMAGYANALVINTWKDHQEVVFLGPEQLAFTEEEAKLHLTLRNQTWNPQVFEETRGWPLGLSLNLTSMHHNRDAVDWILEALNRLPVEVVEVLPLLVGEPEWSPNTRLPDQTKPPEGWLDVLLQAGLPLTHLKKDLYAPHTLLLEACHVLLTHRPELLKRVHHHYAVVHAEAGNWLTAIDHHLKADDVQSALQVVNHIFPELTHRGDLFVLQTLLKKFDRSTLPLHMQSFLCLTLVDSQQMVQCHEILNHLASVEYEDPVSSLVRASIAMKEGNYDEQLAWTEVGLSMEQDLVSKVRLRRLKVAALNCLHRNEEAFQECELYLQESLDTRTPKHMIKAWIVMANTQCGLAQYEAAVESYLKALQLINQYGIEREKGDLYYNLALTLADLNRPTEGLKLLEEGLSLPPEVLNSWPPLLLGAKAALLSQMGNNQQALACFEEAADLTTHFGLKHFKHIYLMSMADCASLDGQLQVAQSVLHRVQIEFPEMTEEEALTVRYSQALLAFRSGQWQEAQVLREMQDDPRIVHWTRCTIPFFLAEIERQQGTLQKHHLDVAFQPLDDLGNDGPLESVALILEDLIEHCVQNQWHPERFRASLKQAKAMQDLQRPVWKLDLQTMGTFRLWVNGQGVILSLKKCEELLAFLILHGPVDRDQLIDALWNGQWTPKIADHFKILIRRLRADLIKQLDLPMDPIPLKGRQYALHPVFQVQCDVHPFRDPQKFPEERLAACSGLFLEASESDWAMTMREQLLQEFKHLLRTHMSELSPTTKEHALSLFPNL